MNKFSKLMIISSFALGGLIALGGNKKVESHASVPVNFTVDMQGHGDNLVKSVDAKISIFDVLSDAYFNNEIDYDDGNYYVYGFVDKDPSTYESQEALETAAKAFVNTIYEEETVGKTKTIYAVWKQNDGKPFKFERTPNIKLEFDEDGVAKIPGFKFKDINDYALNGNHFEFYTYIYSTYLVNVDDVSDQIPYTLTDKVIETPMAELPDDELVNIFDADEDSDVASFKDNLGTYNYVFLDGTASKENLDKLGESVIKDKLLVTKRGGVTFTDMVASAKKYGALGLLIVNHQESELRPVISEEWDKPVGCTTEKAAYSLTYGDHSIIADLDTYSGEISFNGDTGIFYEFRDDFSFNLRDLETNSYDSGDLYIVIDSDLLKPNANYKTALRYYYCSGRLDLLDYDCIDDGLAYLSVNCEPLSPGLVPSTNTATQKDDSTSTTSADVVNKGMSAGGVIGIAIGALFIGAIGEFSIAWFIVKKKSFKELINATKNLFSKK